MQYYRDIFSMKTLSEGYGIWSIPEIENMIPVEFEIFTGLLNEKIQQDNERIRRKKMTEKYMG